MFKVTSGNMKNIKCNKDLVSPSPLTNPKYKNTALSQKKREQCFFKLNIYLHCFGRCESAWVAGLHCCQNLHFAPAAVDIHSRHAMDANSSRHSTLWQVVTSTKWGKNKDSQPRLRFRFKTDVSQKLSEKDISLLKKTLKNSSEEKCIKTWVLIKSSLPKCKINSSKNLFKRQLASHILV